MALVSKECLTNYLTSVLGNGEWKRNLIDRNSRFSPFFSPFASNPLANTDTFIFAMNISSKTTGFCSLLQLIFILNELRRVFIDLNKYKSQFYFYSASPVTRSILDQWNVIFTDNLYTFFLLICNNLICCVNTLCEIECCTELSGQKLRD